MKFANFSSKDSQVLLDTCEVGCLPTLTDPFKVADKGTVPLAWRDIVAVISLLTDTKKQALVKLLGLDNDALIKLIQDNSSDDNTTLATIAIGDVESDQRARLRSALQLVDTNVVIKGILADDRSKIIYWNGSVYGIKRLLYSDLTSTNQRPSYEARNEANPVNGTGSADFGSATNQYYTMFFASRNVFKVTCRHTNGNWALRKLAINNSIKNLTSGSGSYTYVYVPVNGYQGLTRLQFIDDGGATTLDDLQVLYSDATAPTLMNGQVLTTGDFFRVDGSQQILEFKGTHQGSGAWYAVPVSNAMSIDAALDPISTNAVQSQAVYWAVENLRRQVDDFLASGTDIEEPKMVLLDLIPDVTIAGNQDVVFRVYIDD